MCATPRWRNTFDLQHCVQKVFALPCPGFLLRSFDFNVILVAKKNIAFLQLINFIHFSVSPIRLKGMALGITAHDIRLKNWNKMFFFFFLLRFLPKLPKLLIDIEHLALWLASFQGIVSARLLAIELKANTTYCYFHHSKNIIEYGVEYACSGISLHFIASRHKWFIF